jgi:deoxyhypusine synthase
MTEYNTFCYSENYNDENLFQQPRYRVFNKEVGEERYKEIEEKINQILSGLKLELGKSSWKEEWEKVTTEQWEQLMSLAEEVRGDDFKEGFEFISGVKNREKQLRL